MEGLVKERNLAHPTPVDPRSQVMANVSHCSIVPLSLMEAPRPRAPKRKTNVRVMGIGTVVPGGFQSKKNP